MLSGSVLFGCTSRDSVDSGNPAREDTDAVDTAGQDDTDTPDPTGPFRVPPVMDRDGDTWLDTLVFDIFSVPATTGRGIRVHLDNGPDEGDPVLYLLDGTGGLAEVTENTVVCSFPSVSFSETACPVTLYVPTEDDADFSVAVAIWGSREEVAEYSFPVLEYDDAAGATPIEPVLIGDDVERFILDF